MGSQTYHYGLRDVKIAAWLAENSYGPAYDVKGARGLSLTVVVSSDTLRGDDTNLATFSNVDGLTVSFEAASVDLEAQSLFLGGLLTSNAEYEDLVVGGDDHVIPYVAVAGSIRAADGQDLHVFIPKSKVTSNWTLGAQLDNWMLPATELTAVYEGAANRLYRARLFPEGTPLTIPLATTAGA